MAKRLRLKSHPQHDVGYGRPPVATQFQPGQSGNPKGRPKGGLNMATVLERALREKVAITEGGRRKVISKLDAAVKQLVNKAAQGDPKAIQLLISLSKEGGVRSKGAAEPADVVHEADEQVAKSIIKRIREHRTGGSDESDKD